jgi:tetratricopeptide (TPR) repeat protein
MDLHPAAELPIRVTTQYPFPIAFVYRESYLRESDPEQRVRGIIQTFTTSIQYTALICLSEYARARDSQNRPLREPRVAGALERLKRPLISQFFEFVNAATTCFRQHGLLRPVPRVLVPELHDFAQKLEQERTRVPILVDGRIHEQPFLLRKALVELRNTLGHRTYRPNWGDLDARYTPLLHRFLDLMSWCARYPLYRLAGDGRWACLRGAEPCFATEPMPDSALDELRRAQLEQALGNLVLARTVPTPAFLALYPWLFMEPCPECLATTISGLTEEVFLFNGDEGPFLTYLGMRHALNTERPRAVVDSLYTSAASQPVENRLSKLIPPALIERAAQQTRAMVRLQKRSGRYHPRRTRPRRAIESALDAFLDGPFVGFCLLGEAGIGKTSLLCRQVKLWRQQDVVLYYEGRGLFAQGPLESRVLRDLFLSVQDEDFFRLLVWLQSAGRRLILVVDGIHEDEAPATTLHGLSAFIRRYADPPSGPARCPPLKVVFTARTPPFEAALRDLGVSSEDQERRELFPPRAFATRDVVIDGQRTRTHRFVLDRLSWAEARRWYESARGGRPRTPFDQLGPAIRPWLRHPWFLNIVRETFDGRTVPESLWVGSILEKFCMARIFGPTPQERDFFSDRAAFVTDFVHVLRENRTTMIYRGAYCLPPRLNQAIAERQRPLSAYLQLLSAGVLREVPIRQQDGRHTRTLHHIGFVSDALLAYLLSEEILREAGGWSRLTPDHLAHAVREGQHFEPVARAVELLLIELVQSEKPQLVMTLLDAEPEAAIPLLIRMLTAVASLDDPGFVPLVTALAQHASTHRVATVLVETARELLKQTLAHPALTCARAAAALTLDAGENTTALAIMLCGVALLSLGHTEDALSHLDHAVDRLRPALGASPEVPLVKALLNRGNALQVLRRFAQACDSYAAAIAHLQAWPVGNPGPDEHLLPLALMNQGAALVHLGRMVEALACHNAAVARLGDLVRGRDRVDLAPLLVKAQLLLGAAQHTAGQLDPAASLYETVIKQLEDPSEPAFATSVPELALALSNLGMVLSARNQPREALASHNRAVSLLRGLYATGRTDVANDLALSLVNRALTLRGQDRLGEAESDSDESLRIRADLVRSGRSDLVGDLANAQLVKASILELRGRLDDASALNEQVIRELGPFETCAEPSVLVRALSYRIALLSRTGQAAQATTTIAWLFGRLEHDPDSIVLRNAIAGFLPDWVVCLRSLSPEVREEVFVSLGHWESMIRAWVDDIPPARTESIS